MIKQLKFDLKLSSKITDLEKKLERIYLDFNSVKEFYYCINTKRIKSYLRFCIEFFVVNVKRIKLENKIEKLKSKLEK